MHDLFSEWYRPNGIAPTAEDLQNRWNAIESFSGEVSEAYGMELVRLYYGIPLKDSKFPIEYRKAFKEADATFRMRDNDIELQILAGASIAHELTQDSSPVADVIGLAIMSLYCKGLRSGIINPDIINLAEIYIFAEGHRVRAYSIEASEDLSGNIQKSITALKKKLEPAAATPSQFSEQLTGSLENIRSAISKQGEVIKRLNGALKVQAERADMLWWVLGEYSQDLGRSFIGMDISAACLIVGKELADLTILIPGPRPIPALIDKMLKTAKPNNPSAITLKDAINKFPAEWRSKLINPSEIASVVDLCPLHFAFSKLMESNKSTAWISSLKTILGIDANKKIAPLDLTLQMYQEKLLIRAASK